METDAPARQEGNGERLIGLITLATVAGAGAALLLARFEVGLYVIGAAPVLAASAGFAARADPTGVAR